MQLASRTMDFSLVKKGMRARIVGFSGDSEHLRRLQEMGLVTGTEFRVIKVAPFGDPVEIGFRGYRLCLRKGETLGVEIEALE